MELQKENRARAFLRRNGLALLFTAGLFALTYAVVFHFRLSDMYSRYDYMIHAIWATQMTPKSMLASFYNGSSRLWHVCVRLLNMCGLSNFWVCAAIVTAAAQAAAYFILYKTWNAAFDKKPPRWLLAALLFVLFLVNSLTLPGGLIHLTREYTRGAVNTWHNPTNIMVRPFAAAVFYMTVRIYNRRRYGSHSLLAEEGADERPFIFEGGFWAQFRQPVYTRAELVLYPLCILLSVYAKPSFLQFFAPAIFIFLLIDVIRTKGKLLPFCLKLALAYLPALLIFFGQYLYYFDGMAVTAADTAAAVTASGAGAEDSVIVFYYIQESFSGIGEFLVKSGTEWGQTLCLCAFPLFILFADWRRSRHDAAFGLGLLSVFMGRLESLVIHETGSRATDFNFYWGYYVAAWLFWSVAIARYARLMTEKGRNGRAARWGGTLLLVWHLAVGIVYLVHIFQTGSYFY